MTGETLEITVALKRSAPISLIKEAVHSVRKIDSVEPMTFKFEEKDEELPMPENEKEDFRGVYDRFLLDFKGNTYGIRAYFSIFFYTPVATKDVSRIFTINAFNHPAGEFLENNSMLISNHLKSDLISKDLFDVLLFTDDNRLRGPELIAEYKRIKFIM